MHQTRTMEMRLLAVATLVGGCVGDIPEAGSPAGAIAAGPRTGGPKDPGALPPTPDTGLWRLTRTEYTNTLRDLLGDTRLTGNALLADPTIDGLDNNAEELNNYDLESDKYERIANDVVENALAPGSTRMKLLAAGKCAGSTITSGCAPGVVSAFARRAWRRPVDADELDGPDGLMTTALALAKSQGDGIEEGVKAALRMALVSPNFLFRVEVDPPGATARHPLGPYELASRMSYFVWSSTPDDQLLAAADAAGDANLSNENVFQAQLQRMLGDPKADALVANFATQWLDVRKLALVAPNPKLFRSFNEDLRKAMIAETQSFFRAFRTGERNLADMFDADFTFVNASLAKHYGLPTMTGTTMREVKVGGDTHRGGLLTLAGILTLTSMPDRTSPVKRGKWVLDRLLCSPPPPPPPKTPSLDDTTKAAQVPANATLRQRMEAHRTEPKCVSCHQLMDPIGFGLEHYDGIGAWRTAYPGAAIDATGVMPLPDGTTVAFDGAQELSQELKKDPRFLHCLTKTLFSYAMGRVPTAEGDVATIGRLATDVVGRGGRVGDLVTLIASSTAFQFRGGTP